MSYFKKPFIINIVLILVAVIASYSAARMVRSAFIMHAQSAEMAKKIEDLKGKKQQLEGAIAEIQTKEAVEREAKARLNLKKPGEEVVVVVPPKKSDLPAEKPASFWSAFMSFFK